MKSFCLSFRVVDTHHGRLASKIEIEVQRCEDSYREFQITEFAINGISHLTKTEIAVAEALIPASILREILASCPPQST